MVSHGICLMMLVKSSQLDMGIHPINSVDIFVDFSKGISTHSDMITTVYRCSKNRYINDEFAVLNDCGNIEDG